MKRKKSSDQTGPNGVPLVEHVDAILWPFLSPLSAPPLSALCPLLAPSFKSPVLRSFPHSLRQSHSLRPSHSRHRHPRVYSFRAGPPGRWFQVNWPTSPSRLGDLLWDSAEPHRWISTQAATSRSSSAALSVGSSFLVSLGSIQRTSPFFDRRSPLHPRMFPLGGG